MNVNVVTVRPIKFEGRGLHYLMTPTSFSIRIKNSACSHPPWEKNSSLYNTMGSFLSLISLHQNGPKLLIPSLPASNLKKKLTVKSQSGFNESKNLKTKEKVQKKRKEKKNKIKRAQVHCSVQTCGKRASTALGQLTHFSKFKWLKEKQVSASASDFNFK